MRRFAHCRRSPNTEYKRQRLEGCNFSVVCGTRASLRQAAFLRSFGGVSAELLPYHMLSEIPNNEGQPPAIAPTIRNGSAPLTTAAGNWV